MTNVGNSFPQASEVTNAPESGTHEAAGVASELHTWRDEEWAAQPLVAKLLDTVGSTPERVVAHCRRNLWLTLCALDSPTDDEAMRSEIVSILIETHNLLEAAEQELTRQRRAGDEGGVS